MLCGRQGYLLLSILHVSPDATEVLMQASKVFSEAHFRLVQRGLAFRCQGHPGTGIDGQGFRV